jgi:hypothetical protein
MINKVVGFDDIPSCEDVWLGAGLQGRLTDFQLAFLITNQLVDGWLLVLGTKRVDDIIGLIVMR